MGKNQSASGLINVIQYDSNGNVSIVSGSTTLMQVSSSGQIYTTGTISGSSVQSASLAQNSNLLQGTGSVGFATTGSFTTASGSVSSRITQIETVYATTGSNSFRANQSITGSLTISSTLTAQTLVVQTVTSSIVYSSGSNVFGCDINSRQTFTGSAFFTGSSACFAGNIVTSNRVYGTTSGLSSDFNSGGLISYSSGSILKYTQIGYDQSGSFGWIQPLFQGTSYSNLIINPAGGNIGIGTSSPCTNFDMRVAMTTATCGTVLNSFPLATFAINASDNGCRGLQIGSTSGGIGGAPVFLKVFGTSAPFAIVNQSNCASLTIDANNISCFACQVCAPQLYVQQSSNSEVQFLSINNQNCMGTAAVARMDIGNWIAQYALTLGRNGICTTGTRFGDNQANTTFIFDNAASSCGMYIGLATSTGNLNLITAGTKRLVIDTNGIACFASTVCAPTIKAGSSTTLTSGTITLGGYPTSLTLGNGQTFNDNGSGGLAITSGAAIQLTAGSCIFMNCTTNFGKYQKSTNGNWYKIPFSVTKNTGSGTATTYCIVNITDQPDGFNEYFISIEYASRLQGVSDSQTQVSNRMYGVNRFNSGTVAVTNSYILAGGSGCTIDTHAPITAAVVGTCTVVVKVDFSSSISYSSFVWGEIKIYSIENLNNYLTIPYNEW